MVCYVLNIYPYKERPYGNTKIIAVANQKGRVKRATNVNPAASLDKKTKKALITDLYTKTNTVMRKGC